MVATPSRSLPLAPESGGDPGVAEVSVRRVAQGASTPVRDRVVVEEPLEIRLACGPAEARQVRSISITMRTPGDDFSLAAGFLLGEGLVATRRDVADIVRCGPPAPGRPESNVVRVELATHVRVDLARLQRNFFATSSCGICGKASLDALGASEGAGMGAAGMRVPAPVIATLPERLRAGQGLFDATGGLHAAGWFGADGTLLGVAEDVGRHNAVDKVVGAALLAGRMPLGRDGAAEEGVLVVSGRTSFEILQKALAARIPVVVAVGAPSTLAVELATRFGVTLIGFARGDAFNVYSHPERVLLA